MPFYVIQVMPSGVHKLRGRQTNEADIAWSDETEADKRASFIRGWGNKAQVTEFENDTGAAHHVLEMSQTYCHVPMLKTVPRPATDCKNENLFTAPVRAPKR